MNSRQLKATKAMALFMVFCVSQICVQANLPGASVASSPTASKKTAKLLTTGNYPITVNGNAATSGMTIFSGARLLTPERVAATVRIEGTGQLDLAPDTNVSLDFDHNRVNVKLAAGYAVLTTNKNVDGLITTAAGVVAHTDAAKNSSVALQAGDRNKDKDKDKTKKEGCVVVSNDGDSTVAVTQSGASAETGDVAAQGTGTRCIQLQQFTRRAGGVSGLNGTTIAAITIAAGGAAAYGIYRGTSNPCVRGSNPSPGAPRGPNDCNQ